MSDSTDPTPTNTTDDTGAPDEGDGGGSGFAAVLVGFLVIVLVGVGVFVGGLLLLGGDDDTGPTEYVVEVPAGTGGRIARGEQVELIPAEVDLSVGDTIVIANADDQLHEVGPFSVRAGETLRYTFDRAGTYLGNCTVHPSGKVEIIVT